jgi:hypothetical protein
LGGELVEDLVEPGHEWTLGMEGSSPGQFCSRLLEF